MSYYVGDPVKCDNYLNLRLLQFMFYVKNSNEEIARFNFWSCSLHTQIIYIPVYDTMVIRADDVWNLKQL